MWALVWTVLAQATSLPPPAQVGWAPGWTMLVVAVAGGLLGAGVVIFFIILAADIKARRRRT